MRVGLIDAGRMGLPITHRLLGAGHALTGYDIADAPGARRADGRGRTAGAVGG